jgi:hypothetical protein
LHRSKLAAVMSVAGLSCGLAIAAPPSPAQAHPGLILLGVAELVHGWASHGGDSDESGQAGDSWGGYGGAYPSGYGYDFIPYGDGPNGYGYSSYGYDADPYGDGAYPYGYGWSSGGGDDDYAYGYDASPYGSGAGYGPYAYGYGYGNGYDDEPNP